MRTTVLVASIIALVLFPVEQGRAQSSGLHGLLSFAPNATRTVTFSKDGVVLASFEVPKGNFLRLSYDDSQPSNTLPSHLLDNIGGGRGRGRDSGPVFILDRSARVELHGEVEIRAETRQQLGNAGPGASVEQLMPQTALVLAARAVDVVITSVD